MMQNLESANLDPIIINQLKKIENCDLTGFDENTLTLKIPKIKQLKIEVDKCYLVKLQPSAFHNQAVITNWNNGSFPRTEYLKIDISKREGKMIRVVGVGYDNDTHQDLPIFWNGWLCLDELDILEVIE